MCFKRILIKEFVKIIEVMDLEELPKKGVQIKLPDGSMVVLTIDRKKNGIAKLKLIKSG